MVWSGIVRNVTLGEQTLGALVQPIKSFSEMLSNMKQAFNHYLVAPSYYLKTSEADLKEINKLTYDLYGIYSYRSGDKFKIELKNFKDDNIKHTWKVEVKDLMKHYTVEQNDRLFPVTLLKDFDIIVSCDEQPGLIRLDSTSTQKWYNNDFIFHHAINLDSVGNIWIPATKHDQGIITPNLLSIDSHKHYYRDDLIVKVNATSGETMYYKSLTEIFMENGLEDEINKSAYPIDPFHLNDVQPATITSDYFNEGDLFLSFRHLSMIMQFRPLTNKVVRIIEGPFLFQHDVDIISNNSIALLNNNTIAHQSKGYDFEFKPTNQTFERKINHSNVLIYNFEEGSFKPLYEDIFIKNGIFTDAEGLYNLLPNGDLFFEEQGPGILWVVNKDGVVLKTTLKSDIEGYHYLPNWTTTYTNETLNR
jgi:hypothetical protein